MTTTDRQGALDALEELANTRMELSLADWSRICSTIRAALSTPTVPVIEGLDESIRNMYATFDWHGELSDRSKVLEAARAYQQLSTKNEV